MKRREFKTGRLATVFGLWPNRQARETKEILYAGLEVFVNLGDSEQEFVALGTSYPTFWPFDAQDPKAGLVRWHTSARPVVLVFREYLRKVWISDPQASKNGYLLVLLGLDVDFADRTQPGAWSFQRPELHESWAEFRKAFPDVGIGARPLVSPVWGTAAFKYGPNNDFQAAVYELFLENWRARVCPRCSRYFIAEKAAQIYCGTKCSGGVKRARSLEWWRQEGASRRKARRKLTSRIDTVKRSRQVKRTPRSSKGGNES